ncbi:alpha/beta hydrolase-fold protein [Actinomyces oris]|uniref:alpha/beta hydrolase n=1 Tax=Actinomyces oris TaxID=544580 RepID=UPI0028E7B20D|nr:alpha/beta hydrolase-fold protein [Actinomyces oris]
MSLLRSIPLTSLRTIAVVLVLAVVTTVVAAVLLPRTVPAAAGASSADEPTRPTRPALRTVLRGVGRYTARIVMVGVPVLLVVVLGGLLINRPMHYVRTVGDLAKAAAPRAQANSRIESPPKSSAFGTAPASAWKASFHDVGDGSQEATWTGPVSGITLPVRVVLPAGYRPDDGRTYNVLEGLHGWVGDPQSLVTGIASPQRLKEAIDAGRIPPSILVFPSLNADGASQPDCVNINGRPPVGTWTAEEIPRMIQATFPNVTTQRAGWMIMGISAGAYCAARTAYDVPQRFGAVGVMSSYDLPGEGSLAHSGRELQAQNGLSTMLGKRKPDGMRFYVLGAQDDPYGTARTAWSMDEVVRKPDSVTVDTPSTGGHSWTLWNGHFPSLLTWWGSDPAVFAAAGLPAPQGDTRVKATTDGVKPLSETSKDQRAAKSVSSVRAKPFEINGLGTMIVALVVSLGALGVVLFWSPRWGRRRDGGRPSAARLGGAILGRALVIVVAAGLVALTVGIGANASGGFYTSWGDLWASVRTSELPGK